MKYDMFWTIERGEEPAFDIFIQYSYRFGTPDSYWEPGDPPEWEIEHITDPDGKDFQLTAEEDAAIDEWICNNPPEEDYYDYD